MSKETKQPSNIVPLLVAALVCDVAAVDPSTGKKNLIGIFDRILVGQFPTKRGMHVYIKIADAQGHYELEVKYVQIGTGAVLAAAKGPLDSSDRLQTADLYIPFPPLPIPAVGRYEFQVWANSMYLGSATIQADQRPQKG